MTTTTHPWRRATTPNHDRMSDIDLNDELSRLASIAAALSAAIEHSNGFPDRRKRDGAIWLADQLADDLAAIADAFENERNLRAREMEALQ
jgi:hypothetical protein